MSLFTWGPPKPAADIEVRSTRLGDYFHRTGRNPHRGGLWNDGWSCSQWRSAPEYTVRIDRLIATDTGRMSADRIRHHLTRGAKAEHNWPISALYIHGDYWLVEGHHRVAAAVLRGEDAIRVHVIEVED